MMTIMKKLPIAGWIGGAIVCAVILMALVSWVWTPYDPLHAYRRQIGRASCRERV